MSVTTETITPKSVPRTYDQLMTLYPIRIIRDEVSHKNALEVAYAMVRLESLTSDQRDYLDLLSEQIERYEEGRWPIDTMNVTPVDSVKLLLEQNSMSASDLGNLLGNRSLGSAILRGQRQLSKEHIRKLCKRFCVSADLFL